MFCEVYDASAIDSSEVSGSTQQLNDDAVPVRLGALVAALGFDQIAMSGCEVCSAFSRSIPIPALYPKTVCMTPPLPQSISVLPIAPYLPSQVSEEWGRAAEEYIAKVNPELAEAILTENVRKVVKDYVE